MQQAHPETSAKPFGLILPDAGEVEAFHALSERQRGYFLHCIRSDPSKNDSHAAFMSLIRRAKGQRP